MCVSKSVCLPLSITYRYTSKNKHKMARFLQHHFIWFCVGFHWLGVGPRCIETMYVCQTSDGFKPSPHGCDVTPQWNHSLVPVQVNFKLHTSCDVTPMTTWWGLGPIACLTTLFKFTWAQTKLGFHSWFIYVQSTNELGLAIARLDYTYMCKDLWN